MAVNVKGIWNCCKAAVPEMRKRGAGSVINISSLAAVYGLTGQTIMVDGGTVYL